MATALLEEVHLTVPEAFFSRRIRVLPLVRRKAERERAGVAASAVRLTASFKGRAGFSRRRAEKRAVKISFFHVFFIKVTSFLENLRGPAAHIPDFVYHVLIKFRLVAD